MPTTVTAPSETAPLRTALLAQLGGGMTVGLLLLALGRHSGADFADISFILALLQGGFAAMISLKLRAPLWWLPIHLFFMPLSVLVQRLSIAPGWFFAAFIALLLVFWRTDKSRVPLYLSNRPTAEALIALLPAEAASRVLDIGCGDGRLLQWLARARPDCTFVGIEHAPLPWLLAKFRTLGCANAQVRFGDFWEEPLDAYDLIYAFLSPAPMPRLWARAATGMRPGACLVSNSFPVPSVEADEVIAVPDRRATHLFIYHPR